MLRIAIIIVVALVVIALVIIAVGYALPVAHVASRQATVPRPPDEIFTTLSEVARYAEWRSDVTSVELLSAAPLRWREQGSNGAITFVVVESVRPSRLVTHIDDRALPFGGTWTFDLQPAAAGTIVTITEHGEVYNPAFRFMSRFVFGHTATIDRYLASLAARIGR